MQSTYRSNSPADIRASTIDILCLGFTLLLFILTLIFSSAVPDWKLHAIQYVIAAVAFSAASFIAGRMQHVFFSIVLRTSAVTLMFSFLFGAVHSLQHILVEGWMDAALIEFECRFTGIESTLYFQQHMSTVWTEIMMFAYVIYVPLLPFISFFCFWSAGSRASYDYLFNLALAYIVCYTGFILYPVASPLYHQRELYTIPFEGGFFTWCGEWMRHNVHYAGGSLPSPHCAAATVMIVMMWRYNKKLFVLLLPVILTLFVSTVYGRYHYISDGVTGIIAGVLVLLLSPKLSALIQFVSARMKRNSRTAISRTEMRGE